MSLSDAAVRVFDQLDDLIRKIRPADFYRPCHSLGGTTVGQHVRHTLEFFTCLEAGYRSGVVNYDKRSHDRLIETDKAITQRVIAQVVFFVKQLKDKPLFLELGYDPEKEHFIRVSTNAMRELVYNIEHAVHHMATIRIGVTEIAPYLKLGPDFGVAASTQRYNGQARSTANERLEENQAQ